MKKIGIAVALLAIAFLSATQLYKLQAQKSALQKEREDLDMQASALEAENRDLESDLQYFNNEHNLEKEFKSKFNYRDPNEKMFILVPPQ